MGRTYRTARMATAPGPSVALPKALPEALPDLREEHFVVLFVDTSDASSPFQYAFIRPAECESHRELLDRMNGHMVGEYPEGQGIQQGEDADRACTQIEDLIRNLGIEWNRGCTISTPPGVVVSLIFTYFAPC